MSAVEQALSKLNQVVGNLETSVQTLETNMAQNTVPAAPAAAPNIAVGQQPDMFGAANGNGSAVDPDAVAAKIDSAIENVEKILQEGTA